MNIAFQNEQSNTPRSQSVTKRKHCLQYQHACVIMGLILLCSQEIEASLVANDVFRFNRADAIIAAGPEGTEFEVVDWHVTTRSAPGYDPHAASFSVHAEAVALDDSGSGVADAFVDVVSSFTFEDSSVEFAIAGIVGSSFSLVGDARNRGISGGFPRSTFGSTNNYFVFTIDSPHEYSISGSTMSGLPGNGTFIRNEITNEYITRSQLSSGVLPPGQYRLGCSWSCTGCEKDFDYLFLISELPDLDGDGIIDTNDLCPDTLEQDEVDSAGCSDMQVDPDADGYCDPDAPSVGPSLCSASDNCPTVANADQTDVNDDGFGDACVTVLRFNGEFDDVGCFSAFCPLRSLAPGDTYASNFLLDLTAEATLDDFPTAKSVRLSESAILNASIETSLFDVQVVRQNYSGTGLRLTVWSDDSARINTQLSVEEAEYFDDGILRPTGIWFECDGFSLDFATFTGLLDFADADLSSASCWTSFFTEEEPYGEIFDRDAQVRVNPTDQDGDGLFDYEDNCPSVANPDQVDTNSDGYGDACVSPDVTVPDGADLGPGTVVGTGSSINVGVSVGDNSTIGDNVDLNKDVSIGDEAVIGEGSAVGKNVSAGNGLTIGENVVINSGVIIGDNVTIGDNSTIGRGTVIGSNVQIGIVGGGIGVDVGKNVTIGMGEVIADGTVIPAGTTVP